MSLNQSYTRFCVLRLDSQEVVQRCSCLHKSLLAYKELRVIEERPWVLRVKLQAGFVESHGSAQFVFGSIEQGQVEVSPWVMWIYRDRSFQGHDGSLWQVQVQRCHSQIKMGPGVV